MRQAFVNFVILIKEFSMVTSILVRVSIRSKYCQTFPYCNPLHIYKYLILYTLKYLFSLSSLSLSLSLSHGMEPWKTNCPVYYIWVELNQGEPMFAHRLNGYVCSLTMFPHGTIIVNVVQLSNPFPAMFPHRIPFLYTVEGDTNDY
jgi:hypothetical protein